MGPEKEEASLERSEQLEASEAFPLLKNCSRKGIERVNRLGELTHCKRGERLIQEGTPTNGVYFLLEGTMKVFTSGLFKKEQIIRIAREGDIVGHRGINEEEQFPISAQALEDSRAIFIDLESFYSVLKDEAAFGFDMTLFFANELMRSERRMKRLTQLPVRQRVADALLYLHSVFGKGTELFLLPLRRDEIGDLAATSQEQVSRTMSEFIREGLVRSRRGALALLDPQGLQALRDGERV
jgi:CRP-like cAMP-binding protein